MLKISFSSDPASPNTNPKHRIGADGTISLPFNVMVQADGLTVKELEARVHEKYVPKLFSQLTVEVALLDGMVRVIDGFGKVHLVPVQGELSVLRAVSLALGELGRHKRIEVIREDGTRLIMDGIKAMKKPKLDPSVLPGDTIICSKVVR